MDYTSGDFEWDTAKEAANVVKHGIGFMTAARVFDDPRQKVYEDSGHSAPEPRFFCIGNVDGRIITVRFTYRSGKVRIFGAGCWRKGARYYEKND